jgi:hypothetical protein
MRRITRYAALLACGSLAVGSSMVALGGAARADPNNGGTTTTSFFNCTGPPGTPSSFTAARQSGGSGFHLSDGTAVFVGVIFADLTTGQAFSPPGLSSSGNVTTICTAMSATTGDMVQVSGFLTPVS